jgi:iron complex transport system ATP-binding protein
MLLGESIEEMAPRERALVRSFLGANPPSDVPFPVRSVVEAGRYPFSGLADVDEATNHMKVDSAMARADIAHLADRVFTTLSSGEQARVMIARVLAQDCPVALLDEPTASLDLANAERALTVLSHQQAGTTTLCVLHDLNAAAFFCDRLLLLSDGQLVSSGAPDHVLEADVLTEVYRQPLKVIDHPFRSCPLVLTV